MSDELNHANFINTAVYTNGRNCWSLATCVPKLFGLHRPTPHTKDPIVAIVGAVDHTAGFSIRPPESRL